MLFGGLLTVVELALLVYCVLDVITTPASAVRGLPKPAWLVLVVLLPLIGGSAWLFAGRPRRAAVPDPSRLAHADTRPTGTASPDDDEAFLHSLAQRAAEQRRRAEQQRQREQADRDRREGDGG